MLQDIPTMAKTRSTRLVHRNPPGGAGTYAPTALPAPTPRPEYRHFIQPPLAEASVPRGVDVDAEASTGTGTGENKFGSLQDREHTDRD